MIPLRASTPYVPRMSTDRTTAEGALSSVVPEQRRLLQSVGALLVLLGVLAAVSPYLVEVPIALALGAIGIVGGILLFVHAFSAADWRGSLVELFLGVIYATTGMLLMANPELELAPPDRILIAFFAIEGVAFVLLSVALRREQHWEWGVFSGLLSALFAALLWGGLPSTADWGLALLFGLTLVTSGIGLVALGTVSDGTLAEDTREPTA